MSNPAHAAVTVFGENLTSIRSAFARLPSGSRLTNRTTDDIGTLTLRTWCTPPRSAPLVSMKAGLLAHGSSAASAFSPVVIQTGNGTSEAPHHSQLRGQPQLRLNSYLERGVLHSRFSPFGPPSSASAITLSRPRAQEAAIHRIAFRYFPCSRLQIVPDAATPRV